MSGVPADTGTDADANDTAEEEEAEVEAMGAVEEGLEVCTPPPLREPRFPRPQIEKSKSSGLKSKPFLSKKFRNSVRERNFLPSGLS